jgi:hypothetical protein
LHCNYEDINSILTSKKLRIVDLEVRGRIDAFRIIRLIETEDLIPIGNLNYTGYSSISMLISAFIISSPYDSHLSGIYKDFIIFVRALYISKNRVSVVACLIQQLISLIEKTGYAVLWKCRNCDKSSQELSTKELYCRHCSKNKNREFRNTYAVYENLSSNREASSLFLQFQDYRAFLLQVIRHFYEFYGNIPYHEWIFLL